MRFNRAGLLTQPAAVVPVVSQVRATPLEETRPKLLQAAKFDASETQTTGKWPWVFKNPGRCVDLPAEEVFSGFEGLLFDDVSETDSEDDRAYSKVPTCFNSAKATTNPTDVSTNSVFTLVASSLHSLDIWRKINAPCPYVFASALDQVSREVRNACHTFVSLDTAPAPEVVILSKAAAALTGIPLETTRAGSRNEKGGDALLQQVGRGLTGTDLEVFKGVQPSPYSSNYGGHQFGNWAGQLGDGRVCTLGEIQNAEEVAGMRHGSLLEVRHVILDSVTMDSDRPCPVSAFVLQLAVSPYFGRVAKTNGQGCLDDK